MSFQIIRNDITRIKADAIVNTANPNPVYASGTDRAVYEAAGAEELLAERKKIGSIARGEIAVTKAFKLKAKYIFHAVGPVWVDGKSGEYDILAACYQKSLDKAYELKCKSIAFPLIATGVYGFPKDKALQIAIRIISTFLMSHEMTVTSSGKSIQFCSNTISRRWEHNAPGVFHLSPSRRPYPIQNMVHCYRNQGKEVHSHVWSNCWRYHWKPL